MQFNLFCGLFGHNWHTHTKGQVSEWQEAINEELDRLAVLYEKNHDDVPPYANTDTVWRLIREAYKAGYRKAKEE